MVLISGFGNLRIFFVIFTDPVTKSFVFAFVFVIFANILEWPGTPVPPDVLKVGRETANTGLIGYKYITHAECLEAIRFLSLHHSAYCQDKTGYHKYIFIFLFSCYMNEIQVQMVFSQYLQLYALVPNQINLEFCSG